MQTGLWSADCCSDLRSRVFGKDAGPSLSHVTVSGVQPVRSADRYVVMPLLSDAWQMKRGAPAHGAYTGRMSCAPEGKYLNLPVLTCVTFHRIPNFSSTRGRMSVALVKSAVCLA